MDRRPARLAGTRSKLAILTIICVCKRCGAPMEEGRARIDAEAARVVALGASDHRGPIDEGGLYWVCMNDPEGNEFCLVGG